MDWLLDPLHYAFFVRALIVGMLLGITCGAIGCFAALLVTPAATARLLTDRLPVMIGLAAALGSGAVVIGLYASYYIAIASGGAVVLTSTLIFVLVLLLAPQRGVVARWNAQRVQSF